MTTLLIGLGNTLRGDDAAGAALAARVAERGLPDVEIRVAPQLLVEWTEDFARFDRVIVCDAATGPETVLGLRLLPPGVPRAGLLSHAVNLELLAATTRALHGRAPELWVMALPAQQFELGSGLSPVAAAGVTEAARVLAGFLEGGAASG